MDTIFALSTVFGKSGIAVFRISGRKAKNILKILKVKKILKEREVNVCKIYDEKNKEIDKCIIIFFKSPNSFTGEDMIEIQTHGSIAIINTLIKLLGKNFRLADPGEFSKRAFKNEKMNLIEAEGLADLIDAETELQLEQATKHTSGESTKKYNCWKIEILKILSYCESMIDFSEEEVPKNLLSKIFSSIKLLISDMKEIINDNNIGEKIKEGFKVSIIGAPNVGKSSLINMIAKRKIAIVSSKAGTTRDIISLEINLKGYPVTIYDTAGIRDSLDPIEKQGVEKAIKSAEKADIIILLNTIDNIKSNILLKSKSVNNKTVIKVISKVDNEKENIKKRYSDYILHSHKYDEGVEDILNEIHEKVSNMYIQPSIIIRTRHRKNIEEMISILSNINDIDLAIELLAEDLRLCTNKIGNITGHYIDNEAILDQIFSSFCIGK